MKEPQSEEGNARSDSLLPSIVTVGDGRGFVVEGIRSDLLVVTAAHCLPFFPPCHDGSASDLPAAD